MSAPDDRPAGADGDERDPWLREALRHAPDASATPPPALREAILAEARSAMRQRPARRHSPGRILLALWDWLARPPIATGFASVMAAILVGMLWWDRPIDETLPPPAGRAAPATTAVPASPVPAPMPAPVAPETARAPEPSPPATPLPAPAAIAKPTSPAGEVAPRTRAPSLEKRRDETTAGTARESTTARAPAAPAAAAAKAEPPAPGPALSMQRARTGEQGAAGHAAAQAERATEAAQAARKSAAPESPPPSAFADATTPRRERARDAAANASPPPVAPAFDAATRPLAALLARMAAEPQRWHRRGASDATTGLDDATRAWLLRVDAAAAGRWRVEAGDRGDAPRAESSGDDTLQLERDGRIAATLHLEAGGVRLVGADGTRFAPLPADVLADLRASLPPAR